MLYNTSLTEFLLEEQKNFPKAKGDFTLLILQIAYAGKIIASHIQKAGLADMLDTTGKKNSSEDEVIKLDSFSNDLFLKTLTASGQVHAIASEELDGIHYVEKSEGEYVVFLDPLDGSKNTEVNATVGTIFSIYLKDNLLKPGSTQIASGYILYGPSTMLIYTAGNGVNGFTLDPTIGSFILSHPNMRIPKRGNIYSINESNFLHFDQQTKKYIEKLKQSEAYTARYIGSMVADIHRTLLKGGIFLYPSEDKLRLLFEVNPLAFLISQAGGVAISNATNPLDIVPTSLHEKTAIVLGSPENINEYKKFHS